MATQTNLQKREQSEIGEHGTVGRWIVTPRVDVFENDDEYLLVADVPGVDEEKLEVSFARGELTIEGTNGSRTYRRAFTLPDGIDGENIDATMTHGVLDVHLPKAPEVKPRRIDVRGA